MTLELPKKEKEREKESEISSSKFPNVGNYTKHLGTKSTQNHSSSISMMIAN